MKLTKQQKKDRLKNWSVKVMFVVLSTVAVVYFMPRDKVFNYSYKVGMPWNYGQLIATSEFPVYKDDAVVERERDSVMQNFRPYYTYDDAVCSEIVGKLNSVNVDSAYNVPQYYMERLASLVDSVYAKGIVSTEEYERIKLNDYETVRLVYGNMAKSVSVANLFSVRTAYEYIISNEVSAEARAIIGELGVAKLLTPNVVYDEVKSRAETDLLLSSVSGASGMVQAGQKIIDRGDIVTPESYDILKSYERELQKSQNTDNDVPYVLIGQLVLVLAIFTILMSYLSIFRVDYAENVRSTVLLFSLVVFFCIVASVMVARNAFNVFMLPYCMVPIVIRILMDSRTAFMFHVAMVLIISIVLREPYIFMVLQLVTGMIAIQNLRELSQRSQIIRTAFVLTLSYVALYVTYELFAGNEMSKISVWMLAYFGINGLLLLFTYPLLWFFERVFGFVSDVTLVELSNINNPLLMRLSEVAPGTFQHSMQVANLASDVAKKIGARAQLVRTAALYHDVGKQDHPVFFTENQAGANPHERLTPVRSAEVIISHVTNGLALADKHHLPELIKDFIRTHHGLGKTKYFYITYKNEHPDEQVDESIFTYPGPNPSTKEQAILMMADAVEAASRSLKEYTEESISNLVDKIIDAQMSEGYFLNCDITFREISVAKTVFKEKLKIIYHTRISYPEMK